MTTKRREEMAEPVADEVIAEVRAVREALAAEFGDDVDRLFEEARRRERGSGRPVREPSPRRLGDKASA